ncbi:hypothetical protein [Haliea sp. E17]|uniref:hypothetical protein n=1 Tax=Haliea sp. E17 TaxID=3401576 RepID=UPI003AACE685
MINRLATRTSRWALYVITLLGLAACGGGGGGGDDGGFLGPGAGDTDTLFLKIALVDASGNATNQITTAAPATLQTTVTKNKASGAPQSNVIVNVESSADVLINGDAGSSSANTNADGQANFQVAAGQTKGGGTLTVSVTDQNGATITKSVNFQLGATGLRLGYFDGTTFMEGLVKITPDGVLSSEGQAELSVAIVDENDELSGSSESVTFSSSCLSSGDATLTPAGAVSTTSGNATATYSPNGCVGEDSITATLVGNGATAAGTIEIAPPSANGLTFVSAEPQYIVLKGTGGGPDRQEKSRVTFRAVNGNGDPLEGVSVAFSLTTEIGGVSLTPNAAISDADGNISTTVAAGDVATVVRVLATTDSGDGIQVSAVSDILTVSTGLPDQNSISLSVEGGFVVEQALTMDGIEKTLTVRMADKFNNPVPDGTAAVFTTEYGTIDPSCETGRRNGDREGGTPQTGECSVKWTSSAPRLPTLPENQDLVQGYGTTANCPSHNGPSIPCPADLGYIRGGRSTVLVTAIGEESFVDRNGDGIYNKAEADLNLFANITEAFLDHNENGLFDPATQTCINNPDLLVCKAGSEEIFTDFNNNQTFDANGDDPNNGYPNQGQTAVYNGLLCPEEGDGIWCSRELVNVYDSTILVMAAEPADLLLQLYKNGTTYAAPGSILGSGSYTAYVSDFFNNRPKNGTEIAATSESENLCSIVAQGSTTVTNETFPGAFGVAFDVSPGTVEYNSCSESTPSAADRTAKITISAGEASNTWSCLATAVNTAPPDPNDC